MRYAKLINGEIYSAPNPIKIDGLIVGNPPAELLLSDGYKPVRYTEKPTTDPGYIAVPGWEETADEIVQIWTVEEKPFTEEEALIRYANELTGASDETLSETTETLIKIIKEEN